MPRARDSKGARNSLGLGWVMTLTVMTTEVSNRLTNANGVGESFPDVNVFQIFFWRPLSR